MRGCESFTPIHHYHKSCWISGSVRMETTTCSSTFSEQSKHIFRMMVRSAMWGPWTFSCEYSVAHYGNFIFSLPFFVTGWLYCSSRGAIICIAIWGFHLMFASYGPRAEALMRQLLPHKSEEVTYTWVQLWECRTSFHNHNLIFKNKISVTEK